MYSFKQNSEKMLWKIVWIIYRFRALFSSISLELTTSI